MVLEEKYNTYFEALTLLDLQTLKLRRQNLTLRFAQQSLADGKLRQLFPLRRKKHSMDTRGNEKFSVFKANTERYKNSPILTMQRLLNEAK